MDKKKLLKNILIIIALTIGAELFLFNYKSIASNFYGEEVIIDEYSASNGLTSIAEGKYVITDKDDASITIADINIDAKDIVLNIDYKNNYGVDTSYEVSFGIQDDGWRNGYYNNSKHSIYYPVASTRYLTIHPSNNLRGLVINFHNLEEGTIDVKSIVINAPIPFNFSVFRVLIIFSVLSLGYCFIRKESFMAQPVDTNRLGHQIIISVAIIAQIVIFVFASSANKNFLDDKWPWSKEYANLAQQITKGKVNLDYDPSQELIEMENPYDFSLREENGIDYRWDTVYYNNKYYVYYGIVPCLLYYVPYYVLTGKDLYTYQAIIISLIIYCAAIFLLLYQVIKKVFPKTPISVYILLSVVLCNCAGGFFIARRPDCYSVPIITGMALALLGLALWILARRKDDSLNKVCLFFGSLCIALVAGCRPQITIMAFMAFPLFMKEIKDIKHHVKDLLIAIVPFVIVAIGLMYYNAIRFSGPFDFGATYNLTNYDMTKQSINAGRILDAIFLFFFQPPSISATFPFIRSTITDYNYLGMYVFEFVYGGLFAVYPITIASLFAFKSKSLFTEKKWYYFTIMLLVFGIVVALADIEMVGVLARYLSDFAGFFFLAAIMVILGLTNNFFDHKWYRSGLLVVCLIGLIYCFGLFCLEDSSNLTTGNPGLYYSIQSLFSFLG